MYSPGSSRALENTQFMGNKQVIAIFVAGILLMFGAFWAGLSVIRGSAAGGKAATPAGNAAHQPRGAESTPARPPEASSATAGSEPKYVVLAAAWGTLEKAQEEVEKLKAQRYFSAHIKMPDETNSLYRVFIGGFELREHAQQVANELASQGKKGVMIYQDKGN